MKNIKEHLQVWPILPGKVPADFFTLSSKILLYIILFKLDSKSHENMRKSIFVYIGIIIQYKRKKRVLTKSILKKTLRYPLYLTMAKMKKSSIQIGIHGISDSFPHKIQHGQG